LRVLVTGGTGYLGAAIVRALAAHGHTPIVFARRATASDLPVIRVDGDVRDRQAFTTAAQGVDAICHTAALVSIWRPRPEEFDEVNVGGLTTAIDVCRALQIPKLVYTSSFLARPPADASHALSANDYQRTKTAAREVARAAAAQGAPIVSMFPGVVYGPGAVTEGNLVGRLIGDHLTGKLPGIVGASRPWSFSYVDDVAEAHVAALERGRAGVEYVVGGENAPQIHLFELLRQIVGGRLPRRIPFGVATGIACVEEVRARLTGRPPLLTRGAVEIFRHDWSLDSTAASETLGYRIRPLAQGVRLTLAGMVPWRDRP
jgi:NAD+-dependent farnesol dehydrogenase